MTLPALPVMAQNALHVPETMEGPVYTLTMAPSTHEFFDGVQTNTYGFNGSYLVPTLILNRGDAVQMQVANQIGEPSTVHWHGMHVAAEDDGGPHSIIQPGTVWQPDFTVLDRNPLTVDAGLLLDTRVLQTWIGGEQVFERGAAGAVPSP